MNNKIKIKELIAFLESTAPMQLQESYDNCGLLCGDSEQTVSNVLVSLDCTEAVIAEAVAKKCEIVVCHHPVIFKGLKKLTGSNYVERTMIAAIKNGVAIYAIHTNLDNVSHGVNAIFAEKLGLSNTRILAPKSSELKKLGVYVPSDNKEQLLDALFSSGAGEIGNYSECSFSIEGTGSFMAMDNSNPYVGEKGIRHHEKETRIEVVFPRWKEREILSAMRSNHPYEEIAFDVVTLDNTFKSVGAGLIGELPEEMSTSDFIAMVKSKMKAGVVRYTTLNDPQQKIKKVALCGGSGSFLLSQAKSAGAQAFVTGDFKYHEFFDAEGKIVIADIGHFESEQFTIDLLVAWIRKKFPTFAVHFTDTNTNPINYL